MTYDAVVVGAGPAGLATSYALARAGVSHIVLERGDQPGHSWANFYRSLVLHTGRHMSALPGLPFPASTPLFPTRANFVDYLHRYVETFKLPIATNSEAARVERGGDGWIARLTDGREIHSRAVVFATGIAANPYVAPVPGRESFAGRVLHSVEYRDAEPFRGRRVLVVGSGNSGGEISSDLARAGVDVTISIRAGFRAVPRAIAGIPIQYLAAPLEWLPNPGRGKCRHVPLIGFHMVNALRDGALRRAAGVASFTASGVRFTDGSERPFDVVILATGFRAATAPIRDAITLDRCGFAMRRDRVASADQPDLYIRRPQLRHPRRPLEHRPRLAPGGGADYGVAR